MASAAQNFPNRNGPPSPNSARHSAHISSSRATSLATASEMPPGGSFTARRKFIGHAERIPPNPACISADTERALARAGIYLGHTPFEAQVSAAYSMMARLSLITMSLCSKIGTCPALEILRTTFEKRGSPNAIISSSKGMPAMLSAI